MVDLCSLLHVRTEHINDSMKPLLINASFLVQAHYWTGYMALWLRHAGYSIELVNILPTFIDLLRALSSWLGTTLAGCLSLRGLWTFQFSFVIFAIIVLAVWNVPDGLKFAAFYFGGFSGMASPILYSWVNSVLADNYGERGLIISSMMTFGFCTQIWVPLFTFPTVQAPRFPNGYPAAAVFEFCMWAILMFGYWFMRRWKAKHIDEETLPVGEIDEVSSAELEQDGARSGVAKMQASDIVDEVSSVEPERQIARPGPDKHHQA